MIVWTWIDQVEAKRRGESQTREIHMSWHISGVDCGFQEWLCVDYILSWTRCLMNTEIWAIHLIWKSVSENVDDAMLYSCYIQYSSHLKEKQLRKQIMIRLCKHLFIFYNNFTNSVFGWIIHSCSCSVSHTYHIYICARDNPDSSPLLSQEISNPLLDGSPQLSVSATQGIICFSVIFSFRVNWPNRMVGN